LFIHSVMSFEKGDVDGIILNSRTFCLDVQSKSTLHRQCVRIEKFIVSLKDDRGCFDSHAKSTYYASTG